MNACIDRTKIKKRFLEILLTTDSVVTELSR